MKELLKFMLQQLLEYERDKQIGVDKYERDDSERKESRNGYKDRGLNTRLGKMRLKKPQIREFPFRTRVFENYQRREKALLSAIQQMVIDGVSTDKVRKIIERLSEEMSFSKSTVSRLMKELDPIVKRWQSEKLCEYYPYLISDALYFYVRKNGQVIKCPLLISVGVDRDGYRKILGIDIGYAEGESTWKAHIKGLKERGLKRVDLTTSDDNKGFVKALEEELPGTPHQRCMVHFLRDILSKVPAKERKRLSRYIKQIYNAPDKEMALRIGKIVADEYRERYLRVSRLIDEHLEETLTFYGYPERHWRKIRTTNLIESLNRIIKKRSGVIVIFPNAESCIRYVSCVLMEAEEDWQTRRRYMRMGYVEEDKAAFDGELMDEIDKLKVRANVNEELVAH